METKIESLFISYLEGNISKEEEEILINWCKENPGDIKELNNIRQMWNMATAAGQYNDDFVLKEWKLFLKKIERSESKEKNIRPSFWYWFPRVAAVFLLGAIISLAVSYQVFNSPNGEIVYQEIITPAGAKTGVVLPDGSSVWLNASSSIRYSSQFGKKQREIFLTGEAFFDVAHSKSKVFVVQASGLSIKAYGTSFNVKSYPEENTIEATLIEGSIGVKRTGLGIKNKDEVILEPNQRVVYFKPNQDQSEEVNEEKAEKTPETILRPAQKMTYMISKGIDPQPFTSWKNGTLIINSETLDELTAKLERKYDVKIHFESEKLKKLKFSGSLENETVEQVIEAIGIAANIDYEIQDRDVWFKEK